MRARTSGVELRLTVEELHVSLPALLELIRGRGVRVVNLVTRQATLEDVFLHLTGQALSGAAAEA